MDNLPEFIFLHIMKTGGTSFRKNFLDLVYKDNYIYDKTFKLNEEQKRNLSLWMRKNPLVLNFDQTIYPENYRTYKVIYGHFLISKYEHLNRPIITFLRDPVERVISQYYWQRSIGLFKRTNLKKYAKIYSNHMSFILNDNIDMIDFIGITEFMQESLKKFSSYFNINVPDKFEKKRVGKNKEDIDIETRNYIKELNKKDYDLYQKGLEKFHAYK